MTRGCPQGAVVTRTRGVQLRSASAGSAALRSLSEPSIGRLLWLDEVEEPEDAAEEEEEGAEDPYGATAVELGDIWEVVGGAARGGITVRTGRCPRSPKAQGLLPRGARVRALERSGGRLRYELVGGSGPRSGWVSIRFQGKYLLFPAGGSAASQGGGERPSQGEEEERDRAEGEDVSSWLRHLPSKPGGVWRVVGGSASGGLRVRTGWETSSPTQPQLLEHGALIRELERDAGRLRYQLLEGEGPRTGWVNRTFRGRRLLARPPRARPQRRAAPAQPLPLQAPPHAAAGVDSAEEESSEVESVVEGAAAGGGGGEPEARACCWCCGCGLPLNGVFLRCRCPIPVLLQDLEEEEAEAQRRAEWALKRRLRAEYGIGWEEARAPSNRGPLSRMGRELARPEMCCLLLLGGGAPRLEVGETREREACVNLEYLSLALRTGLEVGSPARFSLDMVDSTDASSMLVKRTEPAFLAGTSVGEVLFQADYYLKELAMGQFEQPVPGMRSCLDLIQRDGLPAPWRARVWFVVLEADVSLSQDGVLVPHVRMGVEAREQSLDSNENASSTRPDHPLVRYAEAFTLNFDAIVERCSVIRSLREVAKASVLAKFLQEERIPLADHWFDVPEHQTEAPTEVPQLWNRCCYSRLSDERCMLHEEHADSDIVLWGGVDLSLSGFRLGLSRMKIVPIQLRAVGETDSEPPDATDSSPPRLTEVPIGDHPLGWIPAWMPPPPPLPPEDDEVGVVARSPHHLPLFVVRRRLPLGIQSVDALLADLGAARSGALSQPLLGLASPGSSSWVARVVGLLQELCIRSSRRASTPARLKVKRKKAKRACDKCTSIR